MKTEIQDISATRKNMVVSFTQDEVAAEYKIVLSEFLKMARIPGFRPGKAPAAYVQKQFAKQIDEEFKQAVTSKAYRDGLKDTKLTPITPVDIKTGDLKPTDAATLTFTLDVPPTFALPDYYEIPTGIAPTDPADTEVESTLAAIRAQNAKFEPSQSPAQKGDFIKLSYEGTLADGKPVSEIAGDKQIYAKVPQTWEEVEGENEGLIPGLGAQLSGVKPGDKKTISSTFPADFSAIPALAGKLVNYAIEVQEIRTRQLPELNEEFFKTQNVDNLDTLKTRIREGLKQRKEQDNHNAQRRQITDALNNKVDIEVPATLIEDETQNVLRNIIEDNMRRGVSEDEIEKNKKEIYENAKKAAATRVKTRLILAKIAEKEEIKVDEKDIDAYIYREAMTSRERPEKLVKDLTKDRERLRAVQQGIILDKTLDLLVSKAKVTIVAPKA